MTESTHFRSQQARFSDYLKIARPRHWVKHIFMLPGVVAAWVLVGALGPSFWMRLVFGFASACLISSANYVINEWLDAEHDRHHPLKRNRPGALGQLSPVLVVVEYFILAILGLMIAKELGTLFLLASALFLISGIIYNVPPLRLKDVAYVDVITESVNNPIRLLLGWAIVSGTSIPPLSLLGTFWLGGAFLMAAKRFAELRFICDQSGEETAGLYRKSFKHYTVNSLLISCFLYASMASFLLAVFLIKYRSEYILCFPLFAILFASYLELSLQPLSNAQRPEQLHKEPKLVVMLAVITAAMMLLTFVDIPLTEFLAQSRFTTLKLDW